MALLIDADNSPSKFIQNILTELASYGKVNIRRAYGNWTSTNLNGWQSIIHDHAIQPIQQYDLTKGKNATDIALTIDAMDILYTKNTDAFCIVTSDCDFTPLVTRILSDGKMVIGFGQRKTPSAFVNACSTFLYLDEEVDTKEEEKKKNELRSNVQLLKLLRNALATTRDDNGWSKLSRVGTLISNHASFDSRNYGYSRLSDLVAAMGSFELKRDGNGHYVVKRKDI
ncbi:MAG: NYN domain-containing protein [Candidatus Competibacteraceae bacterium]|nr:NYN domain-containing protein [Candidatus Competibacteraceae bacterium]MCP5132930.1 NYN domain-containing protein [Gammaproteobacteria bacterium]